MSDPIATYRAEKAKRAAHPRPAMVAAEQAYAAMLEREKLAGRGGRPKGSKPVNSVNLGKPGKPRLELTASKVPDLTTQLSPFFGSQG